MRSRTDFNLYFLYSKLIWSGTQWSFTLENFMDGFMKITYTVNILYVLNLEYLQCTSISYYLVYIYYFRNFFSQIILHINISTITCLNLYTDGWTWTLVKIWKKNYIFMKCLHAMVILHFLYSNMQLNRELKRKLYWIDFFAWKFKPFVFPPPLLF